jgi:hypothetical protein
MVCLPTLRRVRSIEIVLLSLAFVGCAWSESGQKPEVAIDKRPTVAILPFGFDLEITTLSVLKTLPEPLSPDDEARQVEATLRSIRADARWLFVRGVATGHQFRFSSIGETDALAAELGINPGSLPSREHLGEFKTRLGADLVVAASILDYGQMRCRRLGSGMFMDLSAETVAPGLATAWNPVLLAEKVGVELLTNSTIFLGGGYLFGAAFQPVGIEARAFGTLSGYPFWQEMEEAFYARKELKQLAEHEREKRNINCALTQGHQMGLERQNRKG